MKDPITVEVVVLGPVNKVWENYTNPRAIESWNAASDDWHTTHAENDVCTGGVFTSRMEAKDGSFGFDFKGTYEEVVEHEKLVYVMEDGRQVQVVFVPENDTVRVVTSFEPELENSREMQQEGWQAILENFKKYNDHT